MVTMRQLEVFATVVREGGVTAAANRLFVSQPTVSDTVRALETELGGRLFTGSGRNRRLSDVGRTYYDYTQRILGLAEEAVQAVTDLGVGIGGRLRLLAVTTAGEHLIPPMLHEMSARYPDVELSLQVTNRAGARAPLAESRADMAIMGRPPRGLAVETRAFAPNLLHLVCAPSYADSFDPEDLDAWSDRTLLMREEGSGSRAATEELFEQIGRRPRRQMVLGSNGAIVAALCEGLGMAVMPEVAVAAALEAGTLHTLDVPGLPIERVWQAVWPAHQSLSRPAQAFLDHLVKIGPRLVRPATITGTQPRSQRQVKI